MKPKEVINHPYTALLALLVLLWLGMNVHTMPELDPANCVEPHPIGYVLVLVGLMFIVTFSPTSQVTMDKEVE